MTNNPKIDYETTVSAITNYICYQMALQVELKPEAVEMVTLFHWNLLDDLLDELLYSYGYDSGFGEEHDSAYNINKEYLKYGLEIVAYLNQETEEKPMHPAKRLKQVQKEFKPSLVESNNIPKLLDKYKNQHASEYLKDIIHKTFRKESQQESIQSFLECFEEPNEYKAVIEFKMLPTSSQVLELATMLHFDVNELVELYKRHY